MTTITQVITALPTAPDPATMTRDEFSVAAAAFVLAQKDDLVPEINTWAGQVNTVKGEINTSESNAATSAATATTQAGIATTQAGLATTNGAAQVALATTQANNAAASALTALNAPGTHATSTTSDTIGLGSTTITVQTGKEFVVGMFVIQASTASPTNYILGQITAYDSGTGVLTHDGGVANGSGTFTAWTVSLTARSSLTGNHIVELNAGNGYGSTNTTIRRYTTTKSSIGTAMTYADSAANGMSITINETGIYEIHIFDQRSSGGAETVGVSVNSTELTTNIRSITAANIVGFGLMTPDTSNGNYCQLTISAYFTAGDVVRSHDAGNNDATNSDYSKFRIIKIGA